MSIFRSGASLLGKLLVVLTLAATFSVGMLGVIYFQLKGEEVSIPKVVGKNFNQGREDLTDIGLRIKKIATRYSNEEPNTILEQRPRAGTTAKSGLMISVVVSEKSPDGMELPSEVKDDEEVIGEIEQQPELKIDKQKPKSKTKKTSPKTRDVITKKPEDKELETTEEAVIDDSPATKTDPKTEPNPSGTTKPVVPATKPVPDQPVKQPVVDNKKPKPKPKKDN